MPLQTSLRQGMLATAHREGDMRQEFYSIYTQLFDRFVAPSMGAPPNLGLELEWRQVIAAELNTLTKDQGLDARLRPDAKYFLLTTLNNMVIRPVVHPDNSRRPDREKLVGLIREDLKKILAVSAVVAAEEASDEISGGMVMTAAVRTWKELVLKLDEIWA